MRKSDAMALCMSGVLGDEVPDEQSGREERMFEDKSPPRALQNRHMAFTCTTIFLSHHITNTMATCPDIQPMQELRCRSTDKVAHIPAFMDPKTGGRVVLWKDIQRAFKNAESIWRGSSLVPFLRDGGFEE